MKDFQAFRHAEPGALGVTDEEKAYMLWGRAMYLDAMEKRHADRRSIEEANAQAEHAISKWGPVPLSPYVDKC